MTAKRGSSANSKGSDGEREVAKSLSKWTGENFMRTLQSGAGGTRAVDDLRMTGDIFAPLGSKNSFSYEVKNHSGVTLYNVFNNNGEIPSFWEQCTTDCRRVSKFGYSPMLIFKIEYRGTYCIFPYTDWAINEIKNNDGRYLLTQIGYSVKRNSAKYMFPVIVTNMKTLITLDHNKMFDVYRGLKWDVKPVVFKKRRPAKKLIDSLLKDE